MTTAEPQTPPPAPAARPAGEPSGEHGLSELVVPGILVALAIFLIVGTVNMSLPPSVQTPGPTFFPIIVIVLLLLMAVLSTVQILRSRAHHRRPAGRRHLDRGGLDDVDATGEGLVEGPAVDLDGDEIIEIPPDVPPGRQPWPARWFSDWRALLTVLGSLVAFIVLLRPAGWILAAAVLFYGVAYALGSRRPVFDLSVALVMSSIIQLIFGTALGLNLPAGFLEGVL
jgi:putative tricarboxylic transport membrane protein